MYALKTYTLDLEETQAEDVHGVFSPVYHIEDHGACDVTEYEITTRVDCGTTIFAVSKGERRQAITPRSGKSAAEFLKALSPDWELHEYPQESFATIAPMLNRRAAIDLAESGFFVFPWDYTKQPVAGFMWRRDSSNDVAKVIAMWRQSPESVPAIDCGRSGLAVIDCDVNHQDGLDASK
jgi:hypothetical protein